MNEDEQRIVLIGGCRYYELVGKSRPMLITETGLAPNGDKS